MNLKLFCAALSVGSIAPMSSSALEPYEGVVFPASWARTFAYACGVQEPKQVTGWLPSQREIRQLEAELPVALDAAISRYRVVLNKEDILRQYAGLTVHGKKAICVNAFPRNVPVAWRKDLVQVFDAGPSYFTVLYDPATAQFDHFSFRTTLR